METASPFIHAQASLDVSVVICSRNRASSLLNVISSIYAQKGLSGLSWEVIAVDNASSDSTRPTVEEWIRDGHPNTQYHYEPNVGQAFAKNRGVIHAKGRLIVFTDDDVIVDEHWLVSYVNAFDKYSCNGMGGRLLPMFSPGPPDWYRADIPFPYRFDFGVHPIPLTAAPFGANMAFRRTAFEKYGLFRTDLGASQDNPTGKGEDSEFCRRLMAAGETIMYVPDAVLHHPLKAGDITRKFMHRWYYQYGRSQVVRDPNSHAGVRLFGVPRHLIRSMISSAIRGFFAADPATRYHYEMDWHRIRGIIAEERARAHRATVPAQPTDKDVLIKR